MEREVDKRLEELRENGVEIYSISRLNTLNQCKYQAYLNYVLHEKQNPNIWAIAGSVLHDKLEMCLKDDVDKSIIKSAINEELENFDLLGIEFPKDKNGNPTIQNNWVKNMLKFSEEFEIPKGKFETEQLIIYPVNDHAALQGYIDVIKHNDDGTIEIWDWKTSSQFQGDHLIEAGRQLCLYAMAKELEGYTVSKVQWCMLKYYKASWLLKNGKTKEKVGEWRNLIKDLKSTIEKILIDSGMDEIDIECTLFKAEEANDFNLLPDIVKEKITVSPYYREYELTPEVREETKKYIEDQIKLYEELKKNDAWKPCDCNSNSFFCANLCGYGGKSEKCKYWKDYCEQFTKSSEDEDLF